MLLEIEYPVNQQERVAVRQQRQHLIDIHRTQITLPSRRNGTSSDQDIKPLSDRVRDDRSRRLSVKPDRPDA
jgi:hypothetical protein